MPSRWSRPRCTGLRTQKSLGWSALAAVLALKLTSCAATSEGLGPRAAQLRQDRRITSAAAPGSSKRGEVGRIESTLVDVDYFYPVDSSLEIHPDAAVAGVYAPDEDTLGPMLEGANAAVVDTLSGIAALVLHPLDSMEGLARLPATVLTLLENSPAYYAHFRAATHGERVRIVSRIVTNLVLIGVSAGAGSTRVASIGGKLGRLRVPVLSLSAQGVLTLERVALPTTSLVTAVSGAPGALYILHMAQRGAGGGSDGGGPSGSSWKPPPGGPGKWIPKNEGMSARSRRYQTQMTGAPEGWVYRVERNGEKFDFDGYEDGLLLDAKGSGYDNKFLDTLEPEYWFRDSGASEMISNARRQLRVANGVPIRWYVAEAKAARAIRKLLDEAQCEDIEVIHRQVVP